MHHGKLVQSELNTLHYRLLLSLLLLAFSGNERVPKVYLSTTYPRRAFRRASFLGTYLVIFQILLEGKEKSL